MEPGTYRAAAGGLMRCRLDRAGELRCEIELATGERRDVVPPASPPTALLSDDPEWLAEEGREALGTEL